MQSTRLFILDAFERHGDMHGHQLRAYAERERVALWTEISVGSLYQVIKRLVAEGLLRVVRTERDGNFPERNILAITEDGRESLVQLRREGLREVVARPDPFDFALTRMGPSITREVLERTIASRLNALREMLSERIELQRNAQPHLTAIEAYALRHRTHVLEAEISWHESLLAALPGIDLKAVDPVKPT